MACLCGDLGCPSCGPAQGSDPASEAAFDYVYARLQEWLDTTTIIVFKGDEDDTALHAPAEFSAEFDVKFSDGAETGLGRLTTLVLNLMQEAVASARSEDAASWAELAEAQETEAEDQERYINNWPTDPTADTEIPTKLASDFNAELEDRLERRSGWQNLPDPISDEDDWGPSFHRIIRDEEE